MTLSGKARSRKEWRRGAAIIAGGVVAASAAIVPLAKLDQAVGKVPQPGTGEAVITVKVGGPRDPSNNLVTAAPAGAVLQLYGGDSDTTAGPAIDEPWATCTSDADGDCSFVVPDTGVGGANRDARFWIGQVTAPPGYYNDLNVVTSADGNTFLETPYQSRTGTQLRAGELYTGTGSFMASASGVRVSSGTWLESMENPAFPDQCGLNAALVMDLSGSVADSNAEDTLRGAAEALVDSLAGTPSEIALFTFGSRAPARGANNINRPLTPVSTAAGAQTVKDWIDSIGVPAVHEATNWDRGLMQVAQSPDHYDVVVVITDGNPTRYGVDGLGTGILTRFVEIENSVFSANAVKSVKGARIIAVGVGDGATSVPGDNFAAISGPVKDDPNPLANDYYQTDWDQAAAVLKSVAMAGCKGSLTVVKQVVPTTNASGDVTGGQLADGWNFGVVGTGAEPGKSTLTTALGTGAASTDFTLDSAMTPGRLTVTETVQTDYDLHPVTVGATLQNAACFSLSGATPVPLAVTDEGSTGFSVDAKPEDVISCTVYNKHKTASPASVKVVKKWKLSQIDEQGALVTGGTVQTFDQGQQPGGFQASLRIALDAGAVPPMTGLVWGTEYGGMTPGVAVSPGEDQAVSLPEGCEVADATVTGQPDGSGGLTAITPVPASSYSYPLASGLNQFELTNSVECHALLSLYKSVDSREPRVASKLWLLDAIALADPLQPGVTPLAGPTGRYDEQQEPIAQPVTADVTPGWTYALAESEGDPEYVQWRVADPAEPLPPEASGSWICNLETGGDIFIDPSGWMSAGLRGAVTVPWGGHAHCFAVNYTGMLTVLKTVDGGSAEPGDWTFTATPTGSGSASLPTHAGLDSGEVTRVKPGQTYTITEDAPGPAGYVLDSVDCTWDEIDGTERTETFPGPPELVVGLGGSATCTFNNRALAHVSIVKSNSRAPGTVPAAGSQFAYYLDVTSDGAAPAQSVDVSDAVPAGLRIVSVTPQGSGWQDLTSANALRLTNAALPVGTYRITVVVAVTDSLDVTKDLTNEACVAAVNVADTTPICSDTTIPGGPPPASPTPPVSPSPTASSPPPVSPTPSVSPSASPSISPSGSPVSPSPRVPPSGTPGTGTPTGSYAASVPPPGQGSPSQGTGQPTSPGAGGKLPFTGAGAPGLITGLAAALLLLGAALIAAGRRRSRLTT